MHLRHFYHSISYYDTLPDITTTILSTGCRDRDLMVISFTSIYVYCNIPEVPSFGVYTSHLIRYFRACVSYQSGFLDNSFCLQGSYWTKGSYML